jgi:murein L,D-transpeptidase YafK
MRQKYAELLILLLLLIIPTISYGESFRDEQSKYPRVRAARKHTQIAGDSLFSTAGLDYPPEQIFIRVFKFEQELELWARNDDKSQFTYIKTYLFTATSGTLGPKRAEGDLQIPEGFYDIDWFNPASSYLLSMRVSYPNKSDWKRATGSHPGGSIFIHGNWVTIGCIPIGDFPIEELYIIAVDARNEGQERIPTHIFPCRMTENNTEEILKSYIRKKPSLESFWNELKPGYDYFEKHRRLPKITINSQGQYNITSGSHD